MIKKTNKGVDIIMKIAVTAKKNTGLETDIDPRFGRANYFAIVDTVNMDVNFIANTAAESSSGAGVGAAQLIADQNVDIVISGSFGPKAFNGLSAADIKLYSVNGGTIKEAVEDYNNGVLQQLTTATNNGHIGNR